MTNFIARSFFWLCAIFIAFLPIVFNIANTPRELSKILEFGSYHHVQKDILFLIVSTLAIGVLDSAEIMIRELTLHTIKALSLAITAISIVIVILCSIWFGSAERLTPNDTTTILAIFCAALVMAYAQRSMMILSELND